MKSVLQLILVSTALSACTSIPNKQHKEAPSKPESIAYEHISLPPGNLAVVIDGNSPDPDDIGATPVLLALLQKAQASGRLVHISHSCDLDPFRNKARYQIDAENESRRQRVLDSSIHKALEIFGPFEEVRQLYNCRTAQQNAIDDLVAAINNASAQEPLWIIEAGEPDLIGYALQAANAENRMFVKVVSHHPANDNSGDYFTWQQILDFGVQEYQIGDQNVGLQTPVDAWDWAKDSEDEGISLIWDMMAYAEQDGIVPFQTGKFDCSDAGMIYWWITGADKGGNKNATPEDIKMILTSE
ncbi:hypothetical protein DXV75_13690 [Alteromonas aestuariivivens]|uniref:DUF1593 domain-containing protein n=1 Tax=Alteromonas aestuariivivens TaxID=1938339 RepID=A0A3D8M5P0_9ALTE|nr:hypothetical protein [Alteromonas aestuariivivens]RDV24472.1 hypothetical protein DXV75_13690 [Alteromonas aestuariivivens]